MLNKYFKKVSNNEHDLSRNIQIQDYHENILRKDKTVLVEKF
jgi:hypothetical protein